MDCKEVRKYLFPFIDRELDEKIGSQIETHLDSCSLCSREFESERRIESAIKEKMPRDQAPLILRQRLIHQIDGQERRSSFWETFYPFLRSHLRPILATLAVFTITIASFFIYWTARTPYFPIFQEALKGHTSFLAGKFPPEIVSSQAEEVSSWFQGKVDFPVAVPEFPGEDTELLGGRLSRIDEQDVVYLFYRSGEHQISFMIHDCTGIKLPRVRRIEAYGREFDVFTSQGYHVIHLEDEHDEVACTIVSDMDLELLLELFSQVRPSSA